MPIPVFVIPHASVLTVRRFGDTIVVECPECGAVATGAVAEGTVQTSGMAHDGGCSVRSRIQAAEARARAEGWYW